MHHTSRPLPEQIRRSVVVACLGQDDTEREGVFES